MGQVENIITSTNTLAPHNIGCVQPFGCIPRIDNDLRLLDDGCIVVLRMVRSDHNAIEFRNALQGRVGHVERVFSSLSHLGEEGIIVLNMSTASLQQFDDREGGRFPKVVNVTLVRDTEYEHF